MKKEDCDIWLSTYKKKEGISSTNRNLDFNIAKSIFAKTNKQFLDIIEYEEAIRNELVEEDEDSSKWKNVFVC